MKKKYLNILFSKFSDIFIDIISIYRMCTIYQYLFRGISSITVLNYGNYVCEKISQKTKIAVRIILKILTALKVHI